MRHRGSCHCGALTFAFDEDAPITEGRRCNCSICVRKGIVISARYHELVEITGLAGLSVYLWNDRDCRHYFCPTCGVYPFSEANGRYRVNLGCVDGVDSLALHIEILDGRSL